MINRLAVFDRALGEVGRRHLGVRCVPQVVVHVSEDGLAFLRNLSPAVRCALKAAPVSSQVHPAPTRMHR